MDNNSLTHWGVKGMKWGVRRYQNKDGTLTAAGKKRYDKEMERLKKEEKILKNKQRTQSKIDKLDAKRKEIDKLRGKVSSKGDSKPRTKTVKDLTNDELEARIKRLEMEKRVSDLSAKDRSNGEKFASAVWSSTLQPAVVNIGKQLVTSALTAAANKAFDMDRESRKEYKFYTNNKKKN